MSNSSANFYPGNKTPSFTVHLPQKILLRGEWSVALAEIHYPYNFFNVSQGENNIYVEYDNDKINNGENTNAITRERYAEFSISPGFYKTINGILTAVNNELLESTECGILSLEELNGRTKVNRENCFGKNIKVLCFSPKLSMQLGFSPGENILHSDFSTSVGNIYFGVPDQMLVYIDIIEPTFIGHEKASIIKIINTSGASKSRVFGDVCSTEYHHMHYTPVLKKEFESISVDIRDCTGAFMPFIHGVSTVKLHFKKNIQP